MMPSIYEQLCSIYEKHDVVYDDVFGQTFIRVFISNLTRYYQDQDNGNIPTLTSPYDKIDNSGDAGTNAKPYPYSCNLTPKIPSSPEDGMHHYKPYDKCVIHTYDIDFDIKNIEESNAESEIDVKFKDELIEELKKKKQELIANNNNNNIRDNGFTVDDKFAGALFKNSGMIFIEEPEVNIVPMDTDHVSFQEADISTQGSTVSPEGATVSPERGVTVVQTKTSPTSVTDMINSPQKNILYTKLFQNIIKPLKDKIPKIPEIKELENINNSEKIQGYEQIIDDILNKINNNNIILNDEKLTTRIKTFKETGEIKPNVTAVAETLRYDDSGDEMTKIDDGPSGGKFIKNKKTRRRNKRSHKKHHKTNKRHIKDDKQHKKSGKNKTRKTKKTKRKNKTV
jgi:hypothetical protein